MARSFVNALSGGKLNECQALIHAQSGGLHDEDAGELDEDADALLTALDKSISDSKDGPTEKILEKLLTKVRAFVAKVSGLTILLFLLKHMVCRYDAPPPQKNTSKHAQ